VNRVRDSCCAKVLLCQQRGGNGWFGKGGHVKIGGEEFGVRYGSVLPAVRSKVLGFVELGEFAFIVLARISRYAVGAFFAMYRVMEV